MKPFSTLTNKELVALTDEMIGEYLDYICAEEGLPLEIVEPTRPEPIVNNECDLLLTEIPSVTVGREAGQKIMDLIDATIE